MPPYQDQVSIIVPTYNESPKCVEALRDLPELTAVAQVIVVDSSDDSLCLAGLAALEGVAGLRLITAATKGRGVQMNMGAATANTAVLLFLHADGQLHEAAASTAISALKAGYYWGRFEAQLEDQRWPFRVIEWAMNKRSAMTHVATGDQALFMTREAFDIVEGFDEIPLMEDVAMSKKLRRIGPICAVPMKVKTSARRWQQQGIFKTIALMWWLRLRYLLGAPPSELAKSYPQIRTAPLVVSEAGSEIPIYLFAKAPVPGKVKSRLCPPLNNDQAAAVATQLLNVLTQKLTTYWPGRTVLAVTPDASHQAFAQLQDEFAVSYVQQTGKDLGERMLNALAQGLETAPAAAVMGADIPSITDEILTTAHQSMRQGKCVVGPARDGGFYLLGLTAAPSALFANIKWGGEAVYQQLLNNAAGLAIELTVLPTLQDCDYWHDLQALVEQQPSLRGLLQAAGVDAVLGSSQK